MANDHLPGRQARVVRVAARRAPIELDLTGTAVLVVDMQNDFGSKGGMFDRAGNDISAIQKVVGPTANVLAAARRAGIKVVYLKMGYLPDLSDLGAPGSGNWERRRRWGVGERVPAPDGGEGRILIRDTWNTDIVPGLEPHAGDLIVYKRFFSGFYATDLDDRLQAMGVRYLIVTGCTTSICVESTVRDAMFRDYLCVLLADCMAQPGLAPINHEATLVAVESSFGWVSSSDQFIEALEEQTVAAAPA